MPDKELGLKVIIFSSMVLWLASLKVFSITTLFLILFFLYYKYWELYNMRPSDVVQMALQNAKHEMLSLERIYVDLNVEVWEKLPPEQMFGGSFSHTSTFTRTNKSNNYHQNEWKQHLCIYFYVVLNIFGVNWFSKSSLLFSPICFYLFECIFCK